MPQLERFLIYGTFFCSYVPNIKHSVSFTFLLYLRFTNALEKDDFFMKYFKLVHAPTWEFPHFMISFLFICSRHKVFGIFNFYAICDSLTPFKVHNFFLKIIFSWCMPQLENSSFYVSFLVDMYKAGNSRYLSLFGPICDSLMPCMIYRFGKRRICDKKIQVTSCPNSKDSSFYGTIFYHVNLT